MDDALAELQRHGVVDAAEFKMVPLREHRNTAVVALDRGSGPELVVKIDDPAALHVVAQFHDAYRDGPLVSALRHVDADHRFIAYDWAAGDLGRGLEPPPDKASALIVLTEGLLRHYRPAQTEEAGWLYAPWERNKLPGRTWQQFLSRRVAGRHGQVRDHLPPDAGALVGRLAAMAHRRSDGPLYLLHGDCGAHNFVFRDGQLSAVIDPSPMVGEPIFELAFAFASWPHDLTLEAIEPAAEILERTGRWHPPASQRRQVLAEEVLIAMYSRVGTFVVNRPADVPAYVEAWSTWTALLETDESARPPTS